jgi:hypothetical protein
VRQSGDVQAGEEGSGQVALPRREKGVRVVPGKLGPAREKENGSGLKKQRKF